jgi:hypothetical protein
MSNFVVNPYQFGEPPPTMDDTGLVCYYKFDESSLSVPNSSQSSDSGGTNYDATAVGATTNVAGKYDDCFSFDGIDDYMQPDISGGVNYSQWNFLKEPASWSMTYWLRRFDLVDAGRLWDQCYDGGGTLANGTTNYLYSGNTGGANIMVTNSTAGRPLDLSFPSTYYNGASWHFYVHTYDNSTLGFRSLIDYANEFTGSRGSAGLTSTNSGVDMTFMRTVGSGQELSAEIMDWTFWNVVIPDSNIQYLWNGGTGQGVYP